MQLTLLGTGNAAGMPLYGCNCSFCLATQITPSLRRTACSALLTIDKYQFLIDGGQWNLTERFPSGSLTAIFLTHFHMDHVQGLFHLRWGVGSKIPVFSPPDEDGCGDLLKHPGILEFNFLNAFQTFKLHHLLITPIPLEHSKLTFGYVFQKTGSDNKIAYLTDTKGLSEQAIDWLKTSKIDLVVIDCSFPPGSKGKNHNNLDDVIEIQHQICAKKIVLTHIGHDFHIWTQQNSFALPSHFSVAYDGLKISI